MYIVISEADIVVESAENNNNEKNIVIRFYDNEQTNLNLNIETAKDLAKKLNWIITNMEEERKENEQIF